MFRDTLTKAVVKTIPPRWRASAAVSNRAARRSHASIASADRPERRASRNPSPQKAGLRTAAFMACIASMATPAAVPFSPPMVETCQAKKTPKFAPLNSSGKSRRLGRASRMRRVSAGQNDAQHQHGTSKLCHLDRGPDQGKLWAEIFLKPLGQHDQQCRQQAHPSPGPVAAGPKASAVTAVASETNRKGAICCGGCGGTPVNSTARMTVCKVKSTARAASSLGWPPPNASESPLFELLTEEIGKGRYGFRQAISEGASMEADARQARRAEIAAAPLDTRRGDDDDVGHRERGQCFRRDALQMVWGLGRAVPSDGGRQYGRNPGHVE